MSFPLSLTHREFQQRLDNLKSVDDKLIFCLNFLSEVAAYQNNVETIDDIIYYVSERIKEIYKN
jgi:hypothetical protein